MKLTKRIAASAVCAVMTMTSMVGMGASAIEKNTAEDISTVTTMSLDEFLSSRISSKYTGMYYTSDKESYINITDDYHEFFNVYSFSTRRIWGVANQGSYITEGSASITGTDDKGLYATFTGGNYRIYKDNIWQKVAGTPDTTIVGTVTLKGLGHYQYATVSIVNSNGTVMQTFTQEH